MDIVKTNKTVNIISISIGTIAYWLILSSYITAAYVFAMSVVGYIICLLFFLTRYNEYAINKDCKVMKRYCDDVLSVCPKCGQLHVAVYSRVFYSRIFMNILKYILFQKNPGVVHVIKIVKCDNCNHAWYGGYMNIKKISNDNTYSCTWQSLIFYQKQ